MRLPKNDSEFNKVVFKGKGVYTLVALSEVFTLKQLLKMIQNRDFSSYNRDWMSNAIDCLS